MPQYLVKQPDGKYAIFSTIVDAFTWADFTEEEAFGHYRSQMSDADARAKVRRAVRDESVYPDGGKEGSGTDRWDDCIGTMRENGTLAEFMKECPHLFSKEFHDETRADVPQRPVEPSEGA